jgi:hypothetical protein
LSIGTLKYPLGPSEVIMNKTRIWVQYQTGHKQAVRELLHSSGAVFHYDFSDLESFVVTLPEGAIEVVAADPQVSDYWYATMMSKDEPVLEPVQEKS